mmetsp:Transcript_6805/g.10337  ORF Transcript_6805/g.10337 Transcript_6805/m.10337 type:complete len:390 (+) Transcript_6805:116-1285(+)
MTAPKASETTNYTTAFSKDIMIKKNAKTIKLILMVVPALALILALSKEFNNESFRGLSDQSKNLQIPVAGQTVHAEHIQAASTDVKNFWERATGHKWNHDDETPPFSWIRSNPILPPFSYGFPTKEVDQKQVNNQQILEPYVSVKVAEHLQSCCISKEGQGRGHFLDVGGNFGWFALLAAASGCDVDSFEPVDWFRYLFATTANLNGFTSSKDQFNKHHQSVNIHPLIVSDTPGIDLTLHIPFSEDGLMGAAGVNGMNMSAKKDIVRLQKETTTIDELGIQPKHHSCAIKVDVEGFEPKAIAGGGKFIAKNRPPMIILELSPGMTMDGLPEMLIQLEGYGYQPHLVDWDVIKNPYPSTWTTPLSNYAVEWNGKKIVQQCGYNCMLLLTL